MSYQRIDYAKTKSYATLQREDPSFVPPTAANASSFVKQNAKRQRDDEATDAERHAKREKGEEDEEEMEIDDEEETLQHDNLNTCTCSVVLNVHFISASRSYFASHCACASICTATFCTTAMLQPTRRSDRRRSFCFIPTVRLSCYLLIPIKDSYILARYQGFQTTQVTWSPTANVAGARVKMAQVLFESPDLASVAKVALDGFTLKKGWVMSVVYI